MKVGIRLQKILARAGFGSRRACETLIEEGRVTVDGKRITEMGTRADPQRQEIRCDGRRVRAPESVYYVMNKPRGMATTMKPNPERPTIGNVLARFPARVLPVGSLDRDADGLLVLTNDGRFCNMLAHPRYKVPRTYRAVLRETPHADVIERMRRGVWLSEGKTGPIDVRTFGRGREGKTTVELTIREGLNREARRAFAKFGIKVLRLTRIRIGNLSLGTLKPGQVRALDPREARALMDLVTHPGEGS